MSGSTENLLKNSHLSTSKESLHRDDYDENSSLAKASKQEKHGGVENKGYQDDHKELAASSSEVYSPYDTLIHQKGTQLVQQKPTASPRKESRRHSSPGYNGHVYPAGRTRSMQGSSTRRNSSNRYEDLRRKAFINSMKRYQSQNPLALREGGMLQSSTRSPPQEDGRLSYTTVENRKLQTFKEGKSEKSSINDTRNTEKQTLQDFGISHQQDNEVQNLHKTILILEKSQLEQYKRRLTFALSERAKLTSQLKQLSQGLTRKGLENDRHSSLSSAPKSTSSPRISRSLVDLNITELYGDCDLSVDYENLLQLPAIPGSAHSKREKMEIPELDLRSLNSSMERISVDNNVKIPKIKNVQQGDHNLNKTLEGEKEHLKKLVNDIWQDNLREDILAEKPQETEDGSSDENNNKSDRKKHLTVEDLLNKGDSNDQDKEKEKTQPKNERNVSLGHEDMTSESRTRTTELYDPVECILGQQPSTQTNLHVKTRELPTEHSASSKGLLRLNEEELKGREYEHLEDFFAVSTLIDEEKEYNREKEFVDGKTEASRRGKENLNVSKSPTTELRKVEKRFNYMTPPGTRKIPASSGNNEEYNERRGRGERKIVPSNISDKLHYYRENLSNPCEDETSRDLTEAYARESDPEKRREIQQQAASEAAMLRREASVLLWEAMSLESICDPNGRVRHVYMPH